MKSALADRGVIVKRAKARSRRGKLVGVSANCDHGRHSDCYNLNCTCHCHKMYGR